MDATYKLLELRLPVYHFMVEDSMGETEVVAVGILVAETQDNGRDVREFTRVYERETQNLWCIYGR